MKNIISLFSILSIVFFSACNDAQIGPEGPQGPEGPAGPAGESSYLFEFEGINFTAPDYEVFLDYPNDFEGLASDVVLVYFLYGTETVNGVTLDVWRLLPQTAVNELGILQYNYDFTKNDVRLFLDANFSKDLLTANETDAWIARVVVVPGNFWSTNGRMDFSDYNTLKESLGLPDMPVHGNNIARNLK